MHVTKDDSGFYSLTRRSIRRSKAEVFLRQNQFARGRQGAVRHSCKPIQIMNAFLKILFGALGIQMFYIFIISVSENFFFDKDIPKIEGVADDETPNRS
jgi:hypothetical protein